jgi:hypothetical protein
MKRATEAGSLPRLRWRRVMWRLPVEGSMRVCSVSVETTWVEYGLGVLAVGGWCGSG